MFYGFFFSPFIFYSAFRCYFKKCDVENSMMQIKQVHERKYDREDVDEWTKNGKEEKMCCTYLHTQRITDDNRRKWIEREIS